MEVDTQPGVWPPPAPPVRPRPAPTSHQRPAQALLQPQLKRPVPAPQGPPSQLAFRQHQVKGAATPFPTGQPAARRPPVPPFVAPAQPASSQHVFANQQSQGVPVSLAQQRLRKQQQEQLDEVDRLYRLAEQRVRNDNDVARTKMLNEYGAAKRRIREGAQYTGNGLGQEGVRQQVHGLDKYRQQCERELQQQLAVQLMQLRGQLQDQQKALERRHCQEKIGLEKEQEAAEVKDEADEVWQWLIDFFDGLPDQTPLFRCFPVFDSARHDRRKLYDFVRMAQLELGWTMDWKMPDVA